MAQCSCVMHAQLEAEREAARQAFSAGNAAAAGEVAGLRAELARALAAHRADEAALQYRRTKNEQEVEVHAHEPACLHAQGSAERGGLRFYLRMTSGGTPFGPTCRCMHTS